MTEETCWHLLVTTRGGVVSILRNLDAHTARMAYRKMLPDTGPMQVSDTQGENWGWSRRSHNSDVVAVDIIGPEGVELDPWLGAPTRLIRWSNS